jgi:dTDP-4-dehydrorhamnose reductase
VIAGNPERRGLILAGDAAAYTAVDRAEEDRVAAFAVNATAPAILAEECAKRGTVLVHYSTDYVFDGSGTRPWKETDATAPLNVYGQSKLAGEQAVLATKGRHYVPRTSWIDDDVGTNFLRTMLRLGAERESLQVVNDQIGAPTSAEFVAAMTRLVANGAGRSEPGIYHVACAGETSWHGFATEIFQQAARRGARLKVKTVTPVDSGGYPVKAVRPKNSRLDCTKFLTTFGARAVPWQEALAAPLTRLLGPSPAPSFPGSP